MWISSMIVGNPEVILDPGALFALRVAVCWGERQGLRCGPQLH